MRFLLLFQAVIFTSVCLYLYIQSVVYFNSCSFFRLAIDPVISTIFLLCPVFLHSFSMGFLSLFSRRLACSQPGRFLETLECSNFLLKRDMLLHLSPCGPRFLHTFSPRLNHPLGFLTSKDGKDLIGQSLWPHSYHVTTKRNSSFPNGVRCVFYMFAVVSSSVFTVFFDRA